MKKIYFFINMLIILSSIALLSAQSYSGGSGTSSLPFIISTAEDLIYLSTHSGDWDKHFEQSASIIFNADQTQVDWDGNGFADGSGTSGFIPIGNQTIPFTGSYNGKKYTISNIYIDRGSTDHIGLFGYIFYPASITNIGLVDVYIVGKDYVGGLVGRSFPLTDISNSFTKGRIIGISSMGGLVGQNRSGFVRECLSNVVISGNGNYIGGLVGYNYYQADISNSYSSGSVYGVNDDIGGLVGYMNYSTASNCYSTAVVSGPPNVGSNIGGLIGSTLSSTVSDSFWDTETSGQSSSAGGTGKFTSEMKNISTFLDAGWDPNIWNIGDGINDGYPYLDWQNPSGTPLPVELRSFTAVLSDNKITLKWETATEVNNYGFEIERTITNEKLKIKNWEKVGFVEGSGNSNSPKEYSFVDESAQNGKYTYRLKQIDFDGKFKYSDVVKVEVNVLPTEFSLSQNYPNPFNPSTTIKFSIPSVIASGAKQSFQASLKIYDILGREVETLVNENLKPGNYEANFDASNLSSGMYFYRISVGDEFYSVKKMILVR